MPVILSVLARYWYVVVIAFLLATTGGYRHALKNEHARYVALRADFDNFKARVERLGQEQQERNRVVIANQERASRETAKNYDARVNAVLDRYKRLLNASSAGSRDVPAIPATTEPADDTARRERLAAVLRAAELQSAQLIELQEFVRANLPNNP